MTDTVKIEDFITANRITMTAERVDCNPHMDSRDMDHWKVEFRRVPGGKTVARLACEHCGQDRRRNDTYVLQSDSGAWKQVGRNCLADFLRSDDASGLAEYAEILADIDEFMSEFEDEPEGGGGRGYQYFSALALLTQVACCVRADGWCSRTEAKDGFGKEATVDTALLCFNGKWFNKQSAKTQEKLMAHLRWMSIRRTSSKPA